MLQLITNVFCEELVSLTSADFSAVVFYAIVWFITEQFVLVFLIFSVLNLLVLSIAAICGTRSVAGVAVLKVLPFLCLLMDLVAVGSICVMLYLLSGFGGVESLHYLSQSEFEYTTAKGIFRELPSAFYRYFTIRFRMDFLGFVLTTTAVLIINSCVSLLNDTRTSLRQQVVCCVLKPAAVASVSAGNLFTFAVFSEIAAISIFFVLRLGKNAERQQAATYYFTYSCISGLLVVVSSILLSGNGASQDFLSLWARLGSGEFYKSNTGTIVLLVALLIKLPCAPFHIWLIRAHVEASTTGSVLLASILLKLPAVALLRVLPQIDVGGVFMLSLLIGMPAISILVCLTTIFNDTDMKRIVALESVIHMTAFVLVGVAFKSAVLYGAVLTASTLILVAHSLTAAALFVISGALYWRFGTRDYTSIRGLAETMPLCSWFLIIFVVLGGAVPISTVFVSELYTILSLLSSQAVFLASFILFGLSMLFVRIIWLTSSVLAGRVGDRTVWDLTVSETLLLSLLVASHIALFIGVSWVVSAFSFVAGPVPTKRLGMKYTLPKLRVLLTRRGLRHTHKQTPFPKFWTWILGSETAERQRRRQILFYLNSIEFKDRIGCLGRGPFGSKNIGVKRDYPWDLVIYEVLQPLQFDDNVIWQTNTSWEDAFATKGDEMHYPTAPMLFNLPSLRGESGWAQINVDLARALKHSDGWYEHLNRNFEYRDTCDELPEEYLDVESGITKPDYDEWDRSTHSLK